MTLDLDPIRQREQAATEGPWGWFDGSDYTDVVADYQSTGPGSYQCRQQVARVEADWYFDNPQHEDQDEDDASEQACADADFIAHARQDVPALLAEIERLRAQLAASRDHVLTEAAAMLRSAPVAAHETDGVDAAADLLLAARTAPQEQETAR